MFKKTAMACAITAAASPALGASWVTTAATGLLHTPVTHTIQGIQGQTEAIGVTNTNAPLALGVEYALNDTVTFTNTVAKATNYNWPTSISTVQDAISGATTNNGALTGGETSITLAASTNVAVGDTFTIATDSTVTKYRIATDAGTSTFGITPAIAEAVANGQAVTFSTGVVNFGLISSDATTATYRVTSATGTGSHINKLIPTPQVTLSPSGLVAAGTNEMTWAASTSTGVAMDANATALVTAKTAEQYSLTVGTKFDGIVDVENANAQFTVADTANNGGLSDTGRDTMKFTWADTGGTAGTSTQTGSTAGIAVAVTDATATASSMAIAGDWTFLDSTTAAGVLPSNNGVLYNANNNDGQKADCVDSVPTSGANSGSLVFTSTIAQCMAATEQAISILNDEDAATARVTIPQQSYTPTASITFTSAAITGNTKTLTADGGSWTLNGAEITAYSVPWDTNTVTNFLWVNNRSAAAATVSATVTAKGASYGPYSLGSVGAKDTMKINSALTSALSAVDQSTWTRADVTVTAPIKAADMTMSASYKHNADADRLQIQTSDDIDGTSK
jgi:hypothetical protein